MCRVLLVEDSEDDYFIVPQVLGETFKEARAS
jgi:hypothetical protein